VPLAVIVIHGKLMTDTGAIEELDAVVTKTLERVTVQGILIDLHDAPFVDPAGFQALIKARNDTIRRGAWFALCCVTKRVHDLLAMSRLLQDKILHVYENREKAIVTFASYISNHP